MLIKLSELANSADPDQTASKKQSDLGQHCLSVPLWQSTRVQNCCTSTVNCKVSEPAGGQC